jgi:membrane associated rhomboid family serine protease
MTTESLDSRVDEAAAGVAMLVKLPSAPRRRYASGMTPWVTRLLIANIGVYFLQQANPGLTFQFAFTPRLFLEQPWTAVTYMFLHGGFTHLLFNMLGLWVFGPPLETRLGGRRFLSLYFISGLSGAALSTVTPVPIIGASGAIYGIMLGYARFWPRQQLLIYGVVPVEARWLVLLFTIVSLVGGVIPSLGGGIAHFAHLGGFVGAWLYLEYLARFTGSAAWRKKVAPPPARGTVTDLDRWKTIRADALHPVNREEYDRVMAKIEQAGLPSLTPGEREFLDRFSARA